MSYTAIVCKLKKVRKHPGADRLNLADVCGYQIITDLQAKNGDLGVFFAPDGALSPQMLKNNNLYSHSELNADPKQKGYFGNNGRIKAQKLRGEKSYGFWCELKLLEWTGADLSTLKDKDQLTKLNDQEVCSKWVNPATRRGFGGTGGVKKVNLLKIRFRALKEHFDTKQLNYEIHKIPEGSILYFTSKCHGTSGRTGNVLYKKSLSSFKTWMNSYFYWAGIRFKEEEGYDIVTGTRRVVLNPDQKEDDGFYSGKKFRIQIHNMIKESRLPKGYSLFYEIIGFDETGQPLMTGQSIEKVQDKKLRKELKNLYGDTMTFSYGCNPEHPDECYKVVVYRATVTNQDGVTEELSWPRTKSLCKELGLNIVPELRDPIIYDGNHETLLEIIETYLDEPDSLDSSHIREGVCLRVESPSGETKIYKSKGWIFKVLEGIIKDQGVLDLEEAEDFQEDSEQEDATT